MRHKDVVGLSVVVALAASCGSTQQSGPERASGASAARSSGSAVSDIEQACIESGGWVAEIRCCGHTADWPDMCLEGTCSCAPFPSPLVKSCQCPGAMCFDSRVNRCVEYPYLGQ
jgi:hypothetical protein